MEKHGWKIIGILGCVLYVLLLWMCVNQLLQFSRLDTRSLEDNHIPQKMHITLQVTDSEVDPEAMAKLDSAVKVMKEWNDYCDEHLIHGLDDLRQETNNVIEKQNGWFAFWLGILALVGALLPFVVQLKVQHDQKQRVESELAKIKELQSEHEKSCLCDEIIKLSYTLITCRENKWGKNDIDRDRFWSEMFDNLRDKTNTFFSKIDLLQSEDISYLKLILLQLHAVCCVYIPTLSNSYKSRKLLKLTHDIGDVFANLSNNDYSSAQDIRDALDYIQIQMNSLKL